MKGFSNFKIKLKAKAKDTRKAKAGEPFVPAPTRASEQSGVLSEAARTGYQTPGSSLNERHIEQNNEAGHLTGNEPAATFPGSTSGETASAEGGDRRKSSECEPHISLSTTDGMVLILVRLGRS
jgi:hypothetical protein